MNQLVLGNYTDDVTLLGNGGEVALGLLGADLPLDIRDISADLVNWKWSWGHAGRTLLDVVAVVPVVGTLKYSDEAAVLIKRAPNIKPIIDPSRLLEAPKEVADHHIIPAFRGKSKSYADFVKQRGINVDDFTITVSGGKGGQHMKFIYGKGEWNQKWMEFIDNSSNATAKDIYQFAGKMMENII